MTRRLAFVCVQNAGRSQMATAFAERERDRRGLDDVEIVTGGTRPAERVHDAVVDVMREVGMDLSGRVPRAVTTAELDACDHVATMGCSTLDIDPDGPTVHDWALDDPAGRPVDEVRAIRDEVERRVVALFDDLEGGRLSEGPEDASGVPDGGDVDPDATADADGTASAGPETQRAAVRERYAAIATDEGEACCGDDTTCCDDGAAGTARDLGYSDDDLDAAGDANLGLGCGNPRALAAMSEGETVLDLGSGAGFDCFLAAREVGESGRVIGVDMTPEMVEKAREKAADAPNVEFRLGEIEHLPVADGTADVVVSNCVVNLSPDKRQVFREAHRALRPGGRLAISDVVLTADLPDDVVADPTDLASCVAGAASVPDLEAMLADAGFVDVAVEPRDDGEEIVRNWDADRDLSEFLVSAEITGRKPARDDA